MGYESLKLWRNDNVMTNLLRNRYVIADNIPNSTLWPISTYEVIETVTLWLRDDSFIT